MHGLMMNTPLSITSIMRFAELNHPRREIVSVTADQPLHRYTYGEAFRRTRRLAGALADLGVQPGDRVATLAWNDHRHFEIYYATSCSGAVCHTVNPRLFERQIEYIINHAEDRWIFTDPSFVELLEGMADRLTSVEGVVIMTDQPHMPPTTLKNALCYEQLLTGQSDDFNWPEIDEDAAAALCYTSGTTGDPKGVLYSHRSTVLHTYSLCMPDAMGLASRDCVMPIVPMFHVCAWGVPYAAPMTGAKLVLPGAKLGDACQLQVLIESEKVTASAGVPTVWLSLLSFLEQTGGKVDSLERIVVGGAACPPSVVDRFREKYDVHVHHAWGMTETSPIGTFNRSKPGMDSLPEEDRRKVQYKQGRGVYGIELRITGEEGLALPHDGKSFGALKVRGPFVARGYFGIEGNEESHDSEGWFDTGDVATIDNDGFMQIVDRTKDLIKSGGEWISSIELENKAVGHPKIDSAAVIAVPHSTWGERPLLVVVRNGDGDGNGDGEQETLSKQELLDWLAGQVAKWWLPDEVVFVEQLPMTATGKVNKRQLRKDLLESTGDP